ncbi:MAG TPA: hypothetical protein VGB63_17020 [Pedobacter sp.]|jgi:predicted secreted protein
MWKGINFYFAHENPACKKQAVHHQVKRTYFDESIMNLQLVNKSSRFMIASLPLKAIDAK